MPNTDVIVIGGGLVGCAAAYYLSKKGVNVTLLEKNQLNRQASGQNAGSLHFQLEHRMVKFWRELEEEMNALIPLSVASQKIWSNLENEFESKIGIHQEGGFMVAETSEELSILKRKFELEKKWSLDTELLSGKEAREIAPYLSDNIIGATYCPTEGHANPRFTTLMFANKARELGAKILTNSEVTAIDKKGCWHVTYNKTENIQAEHVIFAAGNWINELAAMIGIYLPVFPVPLMMNVTERTKMFIPHTIQHIGKRITLKQVDEGNVLIGGGWSSRFNKENGQINFNKQPIIDPAAIAGNCKVATDIVPKIQDLRLLRSWPGVTAITSDQLPLLGEVKERSNIWVAVGGSAFTFGPLYGSILADLIVDRKTEYNIEAFSPNKLSHLNLFMA